MRLLLLGRGFVGDGLIDQLTETHAPFDGSIVGEAKFRNIVNPQALAQRAAQETRSAAQSGVGQVTVFGAAKYRVKNLCRGKIRGFWLW